MARISYTRGIVFIGAIIVLTVNHTNGQTTTPVKRALGVTEREAVTKLSFGIRNFTVELLYHTAQNVGNHLVISPFSVWSVLAIIADGSAGQTRNELVKKLRLQDSNTMSVGYSAIERLFNVNTPTVELATVSRLYSDSSLQINRAYEAYIGSTYKADIVPINFKNIQPSVRQINQDVYQATKGKIDEIVNEDDMYDAKMILTNAVFFKGQWTYPFNASETEVSPFYDESGKQIGYVNMMYQKGPFPFVNLKSFQAFVLELPYGRKHCPEIDPDYPEDELYPCEEEPGTAEEDRLSMLIMLPYAKVPLVKMFQNLAFVPIEELFDRLKEAAEEAEDEESEVWLPRFKIESDIVMNKPLNDVGIFEVFDPLYADLRKIARNTYLSRVIHKAVIEVTEQGTAAAAVTGGKLIDRTFPPKFKANRPFVYFIVEKTTNIIVFSGIYSSPTRF